MNERRRERIASFLEEELPIFFQTECELSPGTLVSILYVEVPTSASRANVFLSVFPDNAKEGVAEQLKMRENEATHFIRSRVKSKYSPVIRFFVK